MLKKILIGFVVVILLFVGVVAMQPNEFEVTREATMNAKPEVVFAQVNNFHNWDGWSPWAKLDPDMVAKYEGPESGVGAIHSWSGNDKVGEGKMTITESKPGELVRIQLEFIKPWEATSDTRFSFAPAGEGTKVTWTMKGQNNFISKAFCMFMDMDKMVGADFEKGLASMKAIVETPAGN